MLCPFCHTQNRDNARFCKGCGRLLETQDADAPQVVEVVAGQPEATVDATVHADAGQPEYAQNDHRQFQTPFPPPPTVSHEDATAASTVEENVQPKSSTGELYDGDESNGDDISNVPTQILTTEQRDAIYARHQHQATRESQPPSTTASDIDGIADAPTLIVSPVPTPTGDEASAPGDIHQHEEHTGDLPVLETNPVADEQAENERAETLTASAATPSSGVQHEEAQTVQTPLASDISQTEKVGQESMEPVSPQGQSDDVPVVAEPVSNSSSTPQTTGTTDAQQATTPVTNESDSNQDDSQRAQQDGQEQGTFPLLAVGALVADRYEVTQVVSDNGAEHVYQVTDHRGYQHCWNCGSEENAEGDEFCVDCGAELANASYTMHEYAPAAQQSSDAQVLANSIIATFIDHDKTYVIEQEKSVQSSFPNGVHLLVATDSDAGNVRRSEPNEDSTLAFVMERVHESLSSPVGLFVIADGMGGHANGQGASRMTIGLIAERIVRELVMPPLSEEKAGESVKALDEDSLASLMQSAIEDANTALVQANQREQSDAGSTLTGFLLVGDYAYIFNVGDSRTYMLRDEKLYQLTTDHSLVGQLVAGGLIEPEDVYTHPQRNQIFRSIGDKVNVQVDLFKQQVHPGDILLSCSDGLWEMVRDPQITELLNNAPDPQTVCSQLIEAANTNGGEDNVSAVVVMVR